jgi:DNA repair protein RadC
MDKLFVENSVGSFIEASDKTILSVASFAAKRLLIPGIQIEGVKHAKEILVPLLAGKDYEVFCVAFLDPAHKLIAFEEMFRGSVTQTPVYIREIVKRALTLNATGVILVHNHPSGTTKASDQDILTTFKMKSVGSAMEIDVLDHFVVAGDQVGSMRSEGDFRPDKMMKIMMEQMAESLGGTIEIQHIEHSMEDNDLPDVLKKVLKELKKKLN